MDSIFNMNLSVLFIYNMRRRLPFQNVFALKENPAISEYAQFVFDRGQILDQHGLLAAVISSSKELENFSNEEIAGKIAGQLALAFEMPELNNPIWYQVITEKRATFSCVPNLRRPPNNIGINNCYIAGDYTESEYPATLETAVRSGISAAKLFPNLV